MHKPFDLATMRRSLAGQELVGFDTAAAEERSTTTLRRAQPSGSAVAREMRRSGHVKLGGVKVGGTKRGGVKQGIVKNGL